MKPAPRKRPHPQPKVDAEQPALPTLDLRSPTLDGSVLTWECPNCGQTFFGEHPPDLCAYCRDFTTWRRRG
ncbi:MAG: hypothetical protein JNJ61_08655 [Anaerolineae bacterium]|nr:hypothetical protein [Anaerolineae bacterium]